MSYADVPARCRRLVFFLVVYLEVPVQNMKEGRQCRLERGAFTWSLALFSPTHKQRDVCTLHGVYIRSCHDRFGFFFDNALRHLIFYISTIYLYFYYLKRIKMFRIPPPARFVDLFFVKNPTLPVFLRPPLPTKKPKGRTA
jgi:hypothetical protein